MKAAFTIVTANYISYAKTLGDSLLLHNPGYVFFICLTSKHNEFDKTLDLNRFIIIDIEQLDDDNIKPMQTLYNSFELSCALKPYFADFILKKNDEITRLKYFDSDIMLFNSFEKTIEDNTSSSIFLTPHFFNPVLPSENTTNDATVLKSGVFNAGYFEIANDSMAFSFLEWWKNRLSKYCFDYKHPFKQIFVDQSWLNLVPIYFKNTIIIDHMGYNTSFFNLHERKVSEHNGNYLVNGHQALVFFHYTGYKYYKHEAVSIYNPKYNYQNTPFLESICNEYRKALISNSIQLILPPGTEKPKVKISVKTGAAKIINFLLRKFFGVKIAKAED